MKDITIKNEKKFIIVRIDDKGEPNGILTHKVSRYGSSKAVSPFNLSNLSNAVQSSGSESLQSELEAFISKKKNYNYSDFKIVEIETNTVIKFTAEVEPDRKNEVIINNNRLLVKVSKDWALEWFKDNDNPKAEIWQDTSYGRELVTNPSAIAYFKNKFEELKQFLKWEEGRDYNYKALLDAWDCFLHSIKYPLLH